MKKKYFITTEEDWVFSSINIIKCNHKTWAGGEEHVVLEIENDNFKRNGEVIFLTRITNSSHLMRTLLIKDALTQLGFKKIELVVPYLPYARQDKVMNNGESFSLKVFAKIINNSKFHKVTFLDPHSLVSPALIDRANPVSNHAFLKHALYHIRSKNIEEYNDCVAVSPDAGAYKKIFDACVNANFKGDIIACNKVRNLKTSEIVKIEISSDVKDKICIIIDDICDGGRTFIELAKILKHNGAKKVILVVTHGIFSYGLEPLIGENPNTPLIDDIYTTDSFREQVNISNVYKCINHKLPIRYQSLD